MEVDDERLKEGEDEFEVGKLFKYPARQRTKQTVDDVSRSWTDRMTLSFSLRGKAPRSEKIFRCP